MSTNNPQPDDLASKQLQQVIDEQRDFLLRKPGVLGVEAGRLFQNGRLTSMSAIIVKVRRKISLSELLLDERIPRRLGGFRVDVVPADPLEQLAGLPTKAAATAAALFDFSPASDQVLTYKPIEGDPIDEEFYISKPILCHASPDASWPVLRRFLSGVNDQLTISMYDFNADYIARGLIEAAQSTGANVELVLDPARDNQEVKIQDRLKEKLQGSYTMTLASVGNGGLFDSAYHEKVVVRDSKAFWLSSGNFSVSSQPDIDPFGPQAPSGNIYGMGNRDWHIIVQDVKLAKVFEQYIRHDIEASSTGPGLGEVVFPDLLFPQLMFAETFAAPAQLPPPVAPRALPEPSQLPVRVRPLLTPDNYIGHIQKLIEEAEKSLYLQLQYIHPSDRTGDEEFAKLIRLVAEKTNQNGFDARIIIGNREARTWIKEMRENWGFDDSKIRVQYKVHNKGILVDGEKVVVGSHNWSGDGTLRNRDASLIIYNSQIAEYYQNIFLNDWQFLASPDVQENLTPMTIMAGEPTPPGMIRVAWNDYYDE
jgi:phosphatidylserine/phosphatidylglycerophosphate/cardiolipin synthase-like enzyme